ncbi:hypothetical protein [Corynebacterium aquatimens]|uniref:Uncharacterized protein n=1 Tax=Corynebacterium aquatimens TaxID=1190508 RepID=A0A931DYP2_9CORY|nr:hypothetical protein [Corynebacterium aquatimens]MBG6121118.1 hypothetical protein [Corynebacterium aquatimens]WJY66326.1 hypothetical protein CAQUA_08160 [Corynebacterium aquatimens]
MSNNEWPSFGGNGGNFDDSVDDFEIRYDAPRSSQSSDSTAQNAAYDAGSTRYDAPVSEPYGAPAAAPAQSGPDPFYTGYMPPVQPPGYVTEKKGNNAALWALVAVLALALVGGGAYVFGKQGGTNTASGGSDVPVPQTPETSSSASSDDYTYEEDTEEETTTSSRKRKSTSPAREANDTDCNFSNYRRETSVTSQAFAEQVYYAFVSACRAEDSYNVTVVANSPVTGYNYTMTCGQHNGGVLCSGGNNAQVYIY